MKVNTNTVEFLMACASFLKMPNIPLYEFDFNSEQLYLCHKENFFANLVYTDKNYCVIISDLKNCSDLECFEGDESKNDFRRWLTAKAAEFNKDIKLENIS